jgi:RNA polymerase sigma-70 factor (ECF subfamily)
MGNDPPDQRFTDLYRANYGRLLRFVARRVDRDTEAEDLVAEVFQIAWGKTVQGEVLSAAWLFVAARNVTSNYRRSLQRGDAAYRRAAAASSAGEATGSVTELVADVLEQLPEAQREILVYRYWDDLGGGEIAALTELSTPAVWVRLHRARQAFKRSFKALAEVGYAQR